MSNKKDDSREMTTEEVRDQFLNHLRCMINYWATIPAEQNVSNQDDSLWRVSGVVFSVLVALDGSAVSLPGFIVAPDPHPDDKKYHIENQENWWPENLADNIKADIAGNLHELLHM